MAKILISGGSGLVGRAITQQLEVEGHQVNWLSRKENLNGSVKRYKWDPDLGTIDRAALNGVDHVIHLAGAGIFDKRWSNSYKKKIIESRVKSAELLIKTIKEERPGLTSFIGCSAVGIYADKGKKMIDEDSPKDNDFLAEVCQRWEDAYRPLRATRIRSCILRMAAVLSTEKGAFPRLHKLARLGLLAPFGNGDFYFPWVHIQDVARCYVHTLFDKEMHGVFNLVATETVTNEEFAIKLTNTAGKSFLPPAIPYVILRVIFGEKANALVKGGRVTNQRLLDAGFKFDYHSLQHALTDLHSK